MKPRKSLKFASLSNIYGNLCLINHIIEKHHAMLCLIIMESRKTHCVVKTKQYSQDFRAPCIHMETYAAT